MNAPGTLRFDRRDLLKGSAAALPAMAGMTLPHAARKQPGAIAGQALTQSHAEQELTAGNTAFALDFYATLRQREDLVPASSNLVFSPFSISQALAMTYAGAGGNTARQMVDTLHYALDQPALHATFHTLNADLAQRGNVEGGANGEPAAQSLLIANALWGEKSYPFHEDFTSLLATYYGAGFQQHDFRNAPEGVRQQINGWVAEQTHDRILDIVPVGAIDQCTRLALANAIWFYGVWQSPFDPDDTKDDTFFLLDGTTVSVPFMFQRASFPYARRDGYQVLELPYAESGFTYTIFLPDEGLFPEFEDRLEPAILEAAIEQLHYTDVLLHLPKLTFELEDADTGGGIDLIALMQDMGMTDAFDPVRADFRPMLDGPPPETDPRCMPGGVPPQSLGLGHVLHKAFLAVDEKSTEAAAATVVLATPVVGAAPSDQQPIRVRIDRPFLFAIRDTRTGTLLFLGRVLDPRT